MSEQQPPVGPDPQQGPPPPPNPYGAPSPGYSPPPPYPQPTGQPGGQPGFTPPLGAPNPGYPVPGFGYQPAKTTSTKAIVALCLGIASFICLGPLSGIPAIFVGRSAVKDIDDSQGRLDGRGMATAAWILGLVNLVIALLVAILVVVIVANTDCHKTEYSNNSVEVNCT